MPEERNWTPWAQAPPYAGVNTLRGEGSQLEGGGKPERDEEGVEIT